MAENNHSYWEKHLDPSNLKRAGSEQKLLQKYLTLIPFEPEIRSITRSWEKGRIIVDLGAGLGQYSIFFSRQGWRVIGVDISRERLLKLQKNLRENFPEIKVHLIQARAEALPFKTNSVDYVFSHSVLIHTSLNKALQEISRVMKKAAAFIEPSLYNPFVKIYRKFLAPAEWKEITAYFSVGTIEQIQSLFPASEFEHLTYRRHFLNFFSYVWFYALPCSFLFRLCNRVFSFIDRFIFKIFSLQWFWMYEIQIRRNK